MSIKQIESELNLLEKENMKVLDLTNSDNLKIVLVLESPHTNEIIHGHPLAGSSGQAVTDYIKTRVSTISTFTRPLGCELKNLQNSELGIMNCSLFPLDPKVYSCEQFEKHKKVIEAFRVIRDNPNSKTRSNSLHQKVEKCLVENLKNRINSILSINRQVIFVPCGSVAKSFLSKCSLQLNLVEDVPHPAYNQWVKKSFSDFDNELKKL